MAETADPNLLSQLRQADRERYVSVLFAPESKRASLAALYLFNADVSRVREMVSEPLPGEIRLQWWRDVIEGTRPDDAAGHRFAPALLAAITRYHLPVPVFTGLLEALVFDLYDDPMPSRTDLEGYLGETSSALIQLACQILNEGDTAPVADAAGHGGVAVGIAQIIRKTPAHLARGQVYLPGDLLSAAGTSAAQWLATTQGERAGQATALGAFVALGLDHLRRSKTAVEDVPNHLRSPFAVLAAADSTLRKADAMGPRLRTEPLRLSPITVPWRMTRFALGW